MSRLTTPAGAIAALGSLTAAASLAAGLPASASGAPVSPAHARAYEHAYHEVARRYGADTPGRNIVRLGVRGGRRATDAEAVRSLTVLERMLAPVDSGAPSGSNAAGGADVPACASESGSDYSTAAANTNPTTGATGRYQIEPATAAGYGCSLATPAGQDACAQVIYEHQGAGAWVGCGG